MKKDCHYELDDELEVEDESESESLDDEELDDEEESESESLEESLELDFVGDLVGLDFLTGGSKVPSSFFFKFLFKIFVRLSLITIFRLFLHSYV